MTPFLTKANNPPPRDCFSKVPSCWAGIPRACLIQSGEQPPPPKVTHPAAMRVALAIVLAVCATAVGVKGASDREPPSDGYEYVTCGSSVKVAHQPTDFRLHSHEVAYGSGSQGQSVTMKKGIEDLNSLWQVTGTPTKACKRGAKVKCGAQIRMLHVPTDKFLHTNPNFQSRESREGT